MAGVKVITMADVLCTEEAFRDYQDELRRKGRGDDRVCRITYAEFRQSRSIHDILIEELTGRKPPRVH